MCVLCEPPFPEMQTKARARCPTIAFISVGTDSKVLRVGWVAHKTASSVIDTCNVVSGALRVRQMVFSPIAAAGRSFGQAFGMG